MVPFTILPHTADIRLKVQGKTHKELFQNALLGMNEIIRKGYCKQYRKYPIKKNISIKSFDTTSLLIDFLSEILTETQINQALFCLVKFNKLDKYNLQAQIFGDKVDGFDQDIKAVTFTEANIIVNMNGFLETVVVFDI